MKKKIFSALLMGVFTLASMSMFVSCKDYDDDINGLDTQQQELLSRLEALEGNVKTNLSTLQDQLTTATENANKALTGVQGLEGTVSEVSNTAQAAGNAATAAQGAAEDAQEAADAAQKTADEALATAKAALEAAGADGDGATALEQVAALANRVGALEGMVDVLTPLMEKVEKAMTEDLPELKEKVDMYEDYFNNLFAMLTGVEIYGTFNGTGTIIGTPASLKMLYGNVDGNSKFGDNEALKNDLKTVFATAEGQVSFTDGADIKAKEGILVRVNPVNANISGDNCAIKIINSLGEDMSDFIENVDVEPYEDLITTRGGKINSGLYKVNFQFVDGFSYEKFEKKIKATVDKEEKDVLFAIAINNTDTVDASRYVASTFDLTLAGEEYKPATQLSFTVDGTDVTDIKNRWNGESAYTEEGTLTGGAENAKEFVWANNDNNEDAYKTPATAIKAKFNSDGSLNAAESNVILATTATEGRFGDARAAKEYLPVEVNKAFTVKLANIEDKETAKQDDPDKIQYYYVTLDENFAGVSAPSELNAWNSYGITGLKQVTPADKPINITITNLAANANKGDKIGFRVFAVNYDGTLVDPDGRAFYVAVGDEAADETVNANINAWNTEKSVIANLPSDFKAVSCSDKTGRQNVGYAEFDKNNAKSTEDAVIYYTLLAEDGKTEVSDWADAKKIKIEFNDMQNFLDDATFSFTIKAYNKETGVGDRLANVLNVNVTKVMPTKALTNLQFKAGQLVNGVWTSYLTPAGDNWNTAVSTGSVNLWDFVTGIGTETNFEWYFANAKYNNDTKAYDKELLVPAAGENKYPLAVDVELIDNETQHATTVAVNYKNISYRPDNKGYNTKYPDYVVDLELGCSTVFACPLDESVMSYSWTRTPNYNQLGQVVSYTDYNTITYGKETPNNVATGKNIADYIYGTNTVDSKYSGSFKSTNLYLADKTKVTATLTSNETGNVDYYTVAYDGAGGFDFTSVSGSTNPVADVPSTLTIKATDAFGHVNTITLPFTVKKR